MNPDRVQAPAVGDTPAAMMQRSQYIPQAAIHALEGNAQALSAARSKAVSMMKHLREQVELKKPWYRRKTGLFSVFMTIVQLLLKFAAAVCSPDLHTNGALPYWTICTIIFDTLTLGSMALSALDI
jgi:hypothetical protein